MAKRKMNRQERRALERQIKSKREVEQRLSPVVCDMLKARQELAHQVEVELYYTVLGLALEELHGFKQQRIMAVWRKADEYMGLVQDDKETLESLKQKLLDRANIECSFT